MPVILNADNGVVSGISGLTTSADNSGVLQFQTSGTATLEISTAGNINIPGTGKRITGDFSNATIANRVLFQSTTTNSQTSIGALPNGTSTTTNLNLFGGTDPANASIAQLVMTGAEARLGAIITGTGTFLPLTMHTGGSERLRIDTSGNVGIGTSSPSSFGKFVVNGASNADAGIFIGNQSLTGSAPTYKGTVRIIDNPLSATGANGGIEFLTSTFGSGYGWKMASIDSSGVQLTFSTRQNSASWTEAMRIDSSGNVGIGCIPSVVGSAAGYKAFYVGGTSGSGILGNGSDTYLLCNAYYDAAWKAVASANVSAYQLSGTTHYLRSASNPGAGGTVTWTNVLTVDKDQTVSLQGASTGISGTGITFPASQNASSNANTLDDYEEGTWTPSITFGGSSTGLTYDTKRTGRYTKIGRIVSLQCNIKLTNKGSSTGDLNITGLPFPGYNGSSNDSPMQVGWVVAENGASGWTQATYGLIWNDSKVYVRYNNGTSFNSINQTWYTNSTEIYFSCTYEIA